jgi:hypothetical protein
VLLAPPLFPCRETLTLGRGCRIRGLELPSTLPLSTVVYRSQLFSLHRHREAPYYTATPMPLLPMPGSPAASWAVYRARLRAVFDGADPRVCAAFWLFGR